MVDNDGTSKIVTPERPLGKLLVMPSPAQEPASEAAQGAQPAAAKLPTMLDEATIKAIAAEVVRQTQETKAAGTAMVPTEPASATELRPTQRLGHALARGLAGVLKIPSSEFMTKVDEKVTAVGIKAGVVLGVGLVLQAVHPGQAGANAIAAGLVAEILTDPMSNLIVKTANRFATKGVDALQAMAGKKADALPAPEELHALPAPGDDAAPAQADEVKPGPAPKPTPRSGVKPRLSA